MSFRFNGSRWNEHAFAGTTAITGDTKVLYNQREITLDWRTFHGAAFYQVQVSLFPDFRAPFVDVSISETDYTFTDNQADDAKRYWRWRPSLSSGTNWLDPWSDVSHYWLDTAAAREIEVPLEDWAFFDPEDVTDIYWLEMIPIYAVTSKNLNRFYGRNRLGELLSEFLTVKDDIVLQFAGSQFISHQQLDEFERFNNSKRSFFMANFTTGKRGEPIPHIWKVGFVEDPAFTMIAAGRPDLLQGTLTLTEV